MTHSNARVVDSPSRYRVPRGARRAAPVIVPEESKIQNPESKIQEWLPLLAPLALAAVLRFVDLGGRPLNPDEARIALAGWSLWRDAPLSLDLSPLLPGLLSLLFGAFGAQDGLARAPAAAAGLATVALPLLLRRHLGPRPALAAVWLLALSPLLVLASRTLGGAALGLLALALVVALWSQWLAERDPRWLVGLGAALALGLGSTSAFVPWLLVAGLAAALAWGLEPARARLVELAGKWRAPALGFAVVVALLDARLLTVPAGLQTGLVDPLWTWVPGLVSGLELRNLALLATVEAALLGAGLVGLALRERRGPDPFVRFLGLWLVLSLPLTLRPAAPLTDALVAPLLPAALLGGYALDEAWVAVRACPLWRPALLALAALVPLGHFTIAALAAARLGEPFPVAPALIALAGLALVALLGGGWLQRQELRAGGIILATSIGLLLALAFVGRLSLRQGDVPALPGEWASPEVRALTADVLTWARQYPDARLTIQPGAARWLRWPLREVPVQVVDEGAPAQVVGASLEALKSGRGIPAGRLAPAGANVQWVDPAGGREWWRWLAQGRDWVAAKPYVIILARS
ncbi:MAG: glycosyltransferase family 39 protein [Chloroflexi bacterium]|nr:glycosyltransferase family 39 protein [Chloroflexota bacterium]